MGLLHSIRIGTKVIYSRKSNFLFIYLRVAHKLGNKLRKPPVNNQLRAQSKKSTMSTTSFLAFALLVVLINLSWSQPGKAAPTDPERAALERAAVGPAPPYDSYRPVDNYDYRYDWRAADDDRRKSSASRIPLYLG